MKIKVPLIGIVVIFILLYHIGCKQSTTPIQNLNHNPVIKSIVFSTDSIASGARIKVLVNSIDPDGDSLAYYWRSDVGIIRREGISAQWKIPADTTGNCWIICRVSDPKGAFTEDSASIFVHPQGYYNHPPVINKITFFSDTATAGSEVLVVPTAYDPDGDSLQHKWEAQVGEIGDGFNYGRWKLPQDTTGLFWVRYQVNDPYGATVTDTARLRVK